MSTKIPIQSLIGKVFSRLTILAEANSVTTPNGSVARRVICSCSCGNEKIVRLLDLRHGKVRSCGCFRSEKASYNHKTHGKSRTRTYKIWVDMKKRCNNPKQVNFSSYGGRGISVCPEWEKSFYAFHRGMGDCPKGYSIERIDVDEGYHPKNCKWIPSKAQARNRRDTRWLTINGIAKPLVTWAEDLQIPYYVVSGRYDRGIRGEKLLSPIRKTLTISFNGETGTFAYWEGRTGITRDCLRRRYYRSQDPAYVLKELVDHPDL